MNFFSFLIFNKILDKNLYGTSVKTRTVSQVGNRNRRLKKEDTVTLKISGTVKAVQKFLAKQQKTYSILIVSKLLPNDADSGVHCFVTLNVNTEVTESG
jgi:hypothetical protein